MFILRSQPPTPLTSAKPIFALIMAFGGTSSAVAQSLDEELPVSIQRGNQQLTVLLGGEVFTTFDYSTYDKPILYPIYGPDQVGMTRNWPMKDDVAGEAHDHPHHKSMWIGHEISDVDFWAEKGGRVSTDDVQTEFSGSTEHNNAIQSNSSWIRKNDGQTMLTSQSTFWFGGNKRSRWIECMLVFRATHGDIHFHDTKEGLFAIRTHPDLRLQASPKHGVNEVFGTALNSEGVSGRDIWGKSARWVLYQGPIDNKMVSIAMYDHPTNLRHPTTWHARHYGLVAANPFGLHHFLGQEEGAGAFRIKSGDSLSLLYRVEFFKGEVSADEVERAYLNFVSKELAGINPSEE